MHTSKSVSIIEIRNESQQFNSLIARGAFGHVYLELLVRWEHAITGNCRTQVNSVQLAAIKTIPNATNRSSGTLTKEVFAELNVLRLLNGHINVTPLLGYHGTRDNFGGEWGYNALGSPSSLCLVFPYRPIDLAEALNYRRLKSFAECPQEQSHLPLDVVNSICCDILSALKHLHSHNILHRDLTPSNLYITKDGRIELGDFGLAKVIPIDAKQMETETGLCTLQYRPPELLLGDSGILHGKEASRGTMDIWSAGCIFAELLTLSGPLFPGQSVLDQLARIFSILGTPTEEDWCGLSQLPDWNKVTFKQQPGKGLQDIFGKCLWSAGVPELTSRMLALDPVKRPSAPHCLQSFIINNGLWKNLQHESVVKALIPSSLLIEEPLYTNSANVDRFAHAKLCASTIATARRNFPHVDKLHNNRKWKCKSNTRCVVTAIKLI